MKEEKAEISFNVSSQLWQQINWERKQLKLRQRRRRRGLLAGLAGVILFLMLVLNFVMGVDRVSGDSMSPGIQDGDWILYSRGTQDYPRGSIIVFALPEGDVVKRVIATGGDRVELQTDGRLSVNGQQVEENYAIPQQKEAAYQYNVPENSFFLLGDRRAVSVDSRDESIGMVDKGQIRGRVIAVFRWQKK
ncbi:signal peptidase I [Holdemania massiliensis]|uniref:signal peptidase I n=1 Tax=Holdemania massiliensis TaxID=1468449 RepID=UPI001F067488|nr:signal peptidase I [Holdemania massiliensis]MCH1942162.1 signal peptidase I [Holdemania massiliensis]